LAATKKTVQVSVIYQFTASENNYRIHSNETVDRFNTKLD